MSYNTDTDGPKLQGSLEPGGLLQLARDGRIEETQKNIRRRREKEVEEESIFLFGIFICLHHLLFLLLASLILLVNYKDASRQSIKASRIVHSTSKCVCRRDSTQVQFTKYVAYWTTEAMLRGLKKS